ncbi:oligosaccharide flippase family protein [Bacteroides faecis]|jgi:polysaccharide biosynthesis protein|nr:oligosaccharide flippase family protein [Bacteroides faecis]MCS2198391.1 oligosaccharide flippase family protein [Bacteroides faecis]
MQSSSRQIKLGALMSYVAIAINIVSGLLYTPWMIHSIGRDNFGLYTLALSVISLFVFDFGLSFAVERFIAKYLAENNQEKANNCIGLVCRLYFAIDIILFVILVGVYFFIPQIYQELTPDEIEKFKVIYVMAALYSVISFPFIPVNGVLSAHEKFVQLKVCDVFHKLFIVITMTTCLLLGYGLYALVLVNTLSGILTIILKIYCIKKYTNQKINWRSYNSRELKEVAGYSGWVTVIALAQRCIFNLAPSILGVLSGSTAIAILGIAITLEGYTYTFANAINGMFLPKVLRIVAQENGNVLPLMIKIGRLQLYIVGLVVFGVVCLGADFIRLWVGPDFNESYLCAILIIVPSLFHLPQMIGNETIFAMNKVKKLAVVYTIMAVINLIGAAILAKPFGAIGISVSVCFAYIVRTIGMDVIFHKDLHIDIKQFFKKTFGALSVPMTLILLIGIVSTIFLPSNSWSLLIVKGIIFVCIYCFILFLVSMNEEERQLILKSIKKVMGK